MTAKELEVMIAKSEKALEGENGASYRIAVRGDGRLVLMTHKYLSKIVKAGKDCLAELKNGGWDKQIKKLKLKVSGG